MSKNFQRLSVALTAVRFVLFLEHKKSSVVQGDSGGPLWGWRTGKDGVKRAVQIGIISRGQKCARINRPGQ